MDLVQLSRAAEREDFSEVILSESLFHQILEATNLGRALDAYHLGLQAGSIIPREDTRN